MQPELGLDTFGDVTQDAGGALLPHAQVIRNVIAEGVLADQLGIDFFGVGEHHRADYAISSPEIVLAAIAAQTTRMRLGTAVTVLSSDDPGPALPAFRHAGRRVRRPGGGDPRPRLLHRVLPVVRLRARRL